MDFVPLSKREENLATEIVDAAFMVHSKLGAGLLERVYEVCFCHELDLREIAYSKQENIPIKYEELYLEDALRLDVVVDNLVICELKAVEEWHPVWEAQLLTYLKLSQKRLGFIINFNVKRIKDGIRRIIL